MNTEKHNDQREQWLFVAAAKGLQGYVLRSDPLKEMVGGSELIETLCRAKGGYLGRVLDAMGLKEGERTILTDAAGAARILFQSKSQAEQLARVWPLLAAQYAPGLEMSVALVEVKMNGLGEAIKAAERALNINRNLPGASIPEAGPWVARNRRTGLPAEYLVEALDEEDRKTQREDTVDAESKRKREAAAETASATLLDKIVPPEFTDTFGSLSQNKPGQFRWPRDLTKLATVDNPYIAVVHADANGLGVAMMRCIDSLGGRSDAAETYKHLCRAIETATQNAARKALEPLLSMARKELTKDPQAEVIVPVRPLVCAGEDFTFVIRANHAVQFTKDYLEELERQTEKLFAPLQEKIKDLKPLTGCAGIAFCKSHFPFTRAYAIAETLCDYAKKQTQRKASALAFLRLKYSLSPSDDYDEFIKHSFSSGSNREVRLTMNPYVVGGQPPGDSSRLSELTALATAMGHPAMPFSGQRELMTRAYVGKEAATRDFERLCQVGEARNKEALNKFKLALNSITGNGLWKTKSGEVACSTPLYDALELIHLKCDLK